MKNKVVIGIDQSYADTGITVLIDKKIEFMLSIKRKNMNNSEYRFHLKQVLQDIMCSVRVNTQDYAVIIERVSTRQQKGGFSASYIKPIYALIATIIDIFDRYDISVYSVDTRSWKAQIVGTTKKKENDWGISPEKYPTIEYMRHRGLLRYIVEEYEGKGKRGVITLKNERTGEKKRVKINDNLADSYCIALYCFLPKKKQKLQEEKF